MQAVNFVYNDDPSNKNQLGFISEAVMPIMPEVTVWNAGTNTYGIDYSKFTPVLVKGVQELNNRLLAVESGTFSALSQSQ